MSHNHSIPIEPNAPVPCAIVSSLLLTLPLFSAFPSLLLFSGALWRVRSIHLHARILLFAWAAGLAILIASNFLSQLWRLAIGECLPTSMAQPLNQEKFFIVNTLGYALALCAEMLVLAERFVALLRLDRYRTSGGSVVILLAALVISTSLVSALGLYAVIGEDVISAIVFFNAFDIANIAVNATLSRYCKRLYKRQLGKVSLNARYQMNEVWLLTRCTLRMSVANGIGKCVAYLASYANFLEMLHIGHGLLPPFYAQLAYFSSVQTISFTICIWLFLLKHSRTHQQLPTFVLRLLSWKCSVSVPPDANHNHHAESSSSIVFPVPASADIHFRMLQEYWK